MDTEQTAGVGSWKRRLSPLVPIRPATEYALLGLLLEGPSYGYDLTRQFLPETELGKVCQLEMSMLYALLKKMEREGVVEGKEEKVSTHKTRRVVMLTPLGRREIEEWLQRPVYRTREVRLDFMVKMYFARRKSLALALGLLEKQLEVNRSQLEQLHRQKNEATSGPENRFEGWVQDFRIRQNQAVLDWLESCLTQLQTED
ncbi:MAG: PadR family transcriptional regulator [Chloroflexi bacterium]|nr:PadR family transcriptional regulator [Chloroflexota bacterium]